MGGRHSQAWRPMLSHRLSRGESRHARVSPVAPQDAPQEMNLRCGVRLIVVLLAVLLSACSSFDTRWKAAATSRTAERWDGRWTSGKHLKGSGQPEGGRLRAVTESSANGSMTAHFLANWIVFSSGYTMTFQPRDAGSRGSKGCEFRGTHDLPKIFGGTYRYEATLLGDHLTARYHSSYDDGTFDLHRVGPAKVFVSGRARH